MPWPCTRAPTLSASTACTRTHPKPEPLTLHLTARTLAAAPGSFADFLVSPSPEPSHAHARAGSCCCLPCFSLPRVLCTRRPFAAPSRAHQHTHASAHAHDRASLRARGPAASCLAAMPGTSSSSCSSQSPAGAPPARGHPAAAQASNPAPTLVLFCCRSRRLRSLSSPEFCRPSLKPWLAVGISY